MNNLEKLESLRQKYYQDTIKQFGSQLQVLNQGILLLMDAGDILVDTVKAQIYTQVKGLQNLRPGDFSPLYLQVYSGVAILH